MNFKENDIYLKRIVQGPLATNCYIVACAHTKEAAIIDPAVEDNILIELIDDNQFNLKYIINTHGHCDHIGGNQKLKEKYCAKLLIHKLDENMLIDPRSNFSFYSGEPIQSPLPDQYLEDGMCLNIGKLGLFIIHTPGHSPGSVSIKVDNLLFAGDTLFKNSIGRTDLPGGSMSQIMVSIRERILVLNENMEILPGHGPTTTIRQELATNQWLQQKQRSWE